MRTNTKKETIDALWVVSKRESSCKDNHFFIDKEGRIVGHGYLQGNGDYFPKFPATMRMDLTVLTGMKKKDIINQINMAIAINEGHENT